MKTVLVTGAGGQLARDIIPRLEAAGKTVLSRPSAALDVSDAAAVASVVEAERPGVIVNCAAYTKVDLAEKEAQRAHSVNRDGARNLAEAANKAGAAMVHISTDFVYDGGKSTPYEEGDATNPLGVYGASKLEGERAAAETLDELVIIRTSWLYGTGGANFVKTMLALGAERDKLRVIYDQVGTPTWTADLAEAVVGVVGSIEAGGAVPYGLYHYSNEGVASWFDFAVAIFEEAERCGAPIRCSNVEPIRTSEYPTPARRPAFSVMDKAKIKRSFALGIPHWRSSLRGMLAELYDTGGNDA